MTKQEIEQRLAEQQDVQMQNPASSAKWQIASKEIHRLAELLTGKKPVD